MASIETRKSQEYNESPHRTSEDLTVRIEEGGNFKNRHEYTENVINSRQITTALSRLTHLNMFGGAMHRIYRPSIKVLKTI